jgi:hypothetical protein
MHDITDNTGQLQDTCEYQSKPFALHVRNNATEIDIKSYFNGIPSFIKLP